MKNKLNFEYNDSFDKIHYPIKNWHKETIDKIHSYFKLPENTTWIYYATIHGVILTFNTDILVPRRLCRLVKEDLIFLYNVPDLRYTDINDNSFSIALTFDYSVK